MFIRWSPQAASDLTVIVRYIHQDNPGAALRVSERIAQALEQLRIFPQSGRPGRIEGTRELVFSALPFVAVYRVKQDVVEIVRVLHGAQQWPASNR